MAEIEPVVRAVGLTKVFRDFWGRPKARAVNDIDFEIRPGEVMTGAGVRFERIRRITGYLVGTLDLFNDAKQAEERDRVKHVNMGRTHE